MEFKVQGRSKALKKYVELLMPGIIKQLKLEKSKKFVLVEISRDIENGAFGSTTNLPGLDSYVIVLKPQKWADLGSTLAHEMVHVKQFAKGQLQVKNGMRYWCGKKYTKRTKYIEQPWEQEAFARQEIIFRRVAEK